jgi:hypothetical protein
MGPLDDLTAAQLPVGTVVLYRGVEIRRCGPLCLGSGPWCGRDGSTWTHPEIDWLAEDAQVLRVGTGQEG